MREWLDKRMQENLEYHGRKIAQEEARKSLQQIAISPFSTQIEKAEQPRRFTPPKFNAYVGKSDAARGTTSR